MKKKKEKEKVNQNLGQQGIRSKQKTKIREAHTRHNQKEKWYNFLNSFSIYYIQ
jgi:hypothetical protein